MKTLLCSLLLSTSLWGQVSQAEIKNFNFSYQAPLGEGTAEAFSYQQNILSTGQKVSVEKVGEDFKINLEGVENQEITLSGAPDLLKEAHTIELTNFNLHLADKASISTSQGLFVSPEKKINLGNLNLDCNRSPAFADVMDQMITGCLQKMSFQAKSLATQGEGVDAAFLKAVDEGLEVNQDVGVKNMKFNVTNGKFNLSAEVKAQISGKVTGKGSASYEQGKKLLTVKIDEVKFGVINLTSKVFDELEKQESSTIKVSRPYVYVTLK